MLCLSTHELMVIWFSPTSWIYDTCCYEHSHASFVWAYFSVLLVISRNGIAGSYGNSLLNTMRFVLQTSAHPERPVKCFKQGELIIKRDPGDGRQLGSSISKKRISKTQAAIALTHSPFRVPTEMGLQLFYFILFGTNLFENRSRYAIP